MKTLKKFTALLLGVCLIFCFVGCGDSDDAYDNFKPVGVEVIDCVRGDNYEVNIEDEDTAKELWSLYKSLEINEDSTAEMGTSYLYLRFYNKDASVEAIFTIYENGACCLGTEYETFYTVTGGSAAYIDMCEIYEMYVAEQEQ